MLSRREVVGTVFAASVLAAKAEAAVSRGEPVAASEYYFRTTAEFEAPTESTYAWLNRSVFVGVAERTSSAAIIRFYEVL
jgi:hypothetical protein